MTVTEGRQAPERWRVEWAELYSEVVTSGLCTGCAACIVACPHDVLGYDTEAGAYKPFHLEDELGPGGCTHGLRGCTSCTRACPRFRNWETEADTFLFGRPRLPEEQAGVTKSVLLARATNPEFLASGQDGGVVSAILLWCLEHDRIDAALVSLLEGDGSGWRAVPGVARTREEILAAAGSQLHLLGQPAGLRRGRLRRGRAICPCGNGVPNLRAGSHEVAKGGQGRPPPRPVHRPYVLEDF